MTDSQYAFVLGLIMAAILLLPVTFLYKKRAERLAYHNRLIANDNDFLHSEMMMIVSRTPPELVQELKQSDHYKKMVAQYKANRVKIHEFGDSL